jgi:hypothetical protein
MHLKVLKILTLHFNATLKTSIKDKLVLRFSSACFEPHFCHVGTVTPVYIEPQLDQLLD